MRGGSATLSVYISMLKFNSDDQNREVIANSAAKALGERAKQETRRTRIAIEQNSGAS